MLINGRLQECVRLGNHWHASLGPSPKSGYSSISSKDALDLRPFIEYHTDIISLENKYVPVIRKKFAIAIDAHRLHNNLSESIGLPLFIY